MSDINLSKYTILGISGFAGAGKDTIADWFCMEHGFKKLSLATPIKEAVCDILGLTKDQVHGGLKDVELPGGYTPRQALQLLGTEWGRKLDPDIWIKKVLRSIAQSNHSRWVIPDCRFLNELVAIRQAGGTLLRVVRGECSDPHPSETEMTTIPDDMFDEVIHNTSTLSRLYVKAANSNTARQLVNARMDTVLGFFGTEEENCVLLTLRNRGECCVTHKQWARNVAKHLPHAMTIREASPHDFTSEHIALDPNQFGSWLHHHTHVRYDCERVGPYKIIPNVRQYTGSDAEVFEAEDYFSALQKVEARLKKRGVRNQLAGVQQETINFVDGLLGYTPMIWSPPVYKFVHMAKWWIEKEEE